MIKQEYTLEEISYSRKEDCRIMESVLSQWFQDPKALNLVSPTLTYPFKFKKWLSKYYKKESEIRTLVFTRQNWIIGHVSFRIESNCIHIYHLFIDPSYRQKGLAKKMIKKIEKYGEQIRLKTFSLNVLSQNIIALKLYQKLGYLKTGQKNSGYITLIKQLN